MPFPYCHPYFWEKNPELRPLRSLWDEAGEEMNRNIEVIQTGGRVIHWAGFYDRLVKVLMLGKEREKRKATVELAGAKALDLSRALAGKEEV